MRGRNADSMEGEANCRLHPLIHTLLEFNLSQDIEGIKKRTLSSVSVV